MRADEPCRAKYSDCRDGGTDLRNLYAGEGGGVDGGGAGFSQGLAGGAQRCARREHVVDEQKARAGELANLTGVTSPYEPPEHPAITVDTGVESLESAAERIVALVAKRIG